ncbi:MFS transporter [Nocardioides carbamazepini]|uniref:MFS transporter n=1 Tax=Nocardioides carbamazepini TaxID=2854259 RepID=UPI00214A40F4|nr:MFS transporter [Nocardioides carbamazepini]MCR1785811.1 MFS transporter [Nocardioides carbamazepini]
MAAVTVCGATAGMLLLDIHKVSLAIPSIERSLGAGPTGIQLVSAAYVVLFAITLVPAGQIGDRGYRMRLAYLGLWGGLLAGLICTLAPSIEVLVLGRALAGIAAGMLMPQMMGIVQQLFEPAERGRAFGRYGVCVSLATALGPSLGGVLMALPQLGWRGVFALNVPIILGLLVAAYRVLDGVAATRAEEQHRLDVDLTGVLLGSTALVLVLAPLVTTTGRADDSPARWLVLVPAAALTAAFVVHCRRRSALGRTSVVDPRLLRIATFRSGVLVSLTWFASGPGVNLALMIYLQSARGLSALEVGLLTLPASLTSVLGAHLGGRLVDQWGRALTVAGILVSAGGVLGVLGLVRAEAPTATLAVALPCLQLLSGLGAGLVVSPNHTLTLQDVPRDRGSAAGAIGQLGQRIANSLGVASASMAYYAPVYGAGLSLQSAPEQVHRTALFSATAVALGFLVVALLVAVRDLVLARARPGVHRPPGR